MDKTRINLKGIREIFRKRDDETLNVGGGPSADELMNPSKYVSQNERRSTFRRHHLGE